MVVAYYSPYPPATAVVLDDGQRVRQAGALYVPVRGSDQRIHWAYEPKLRVQRIDLWCQDSRFADAPRGAADSASTHLEGARPCEWCICLAPLPAHTADPDAEKVMG